MNKLFLIGGFIVMSLIGTWWVSKPKTLDTSGLNLIKQFEGLRLNVYNDVAGYPTIGYGHLLLVGENLTVISEREAEELLRRDVRRFEVAVNEYVTVPLSQNMFNGLVSFSYNVGTVALKDSTLLKKLNGGDYIGAANELERWNKAGGKVVKGLINRRLDEQRTFFS